MRATRLYIDTKVIKSNIVKIKNYVGNNIEIMPIIKCQAYGTHLDKLINIINLFKYVGVALVDEGVALRKKGYNGQILILYPPTKDELKEILKYNLLFNGCDIDTLEYFSHKTKKKLIIHLEIETGMGRSGVQLKNLDTFLNCLLKLKNIEIDGIYSHLSSSSSNQEFTIRQTNKFKEALNIINKYNIVYQYTHLFNSGAIPYAKDENFNMIRIGLLIYGYYPNQNLRKIIDVQPTMKLLTKISYLKEIDKNEAVGYNQNFISKKKSLIATIPFGFGDGLIGMETGKPFVIINHKKAKIIAICMDNMMIDVTDVPNVRVGDEVIIFDEKQLTVEEISIWCNGLCNYEIISSLSDRIPRIFI